MTWQDYLKERYGGRLIADSVIQVQAGLAEALKAGRIVKDPILGYKGLAFREALEANGFLCNLKNAVPTRACPMTPSVKNNPAPVKNNPLPVKKDATPVDDFDPNQVIADIDAGTLDTIHIQRGFADNTAMVAEYQQSRDRSQAVYENLFIANQGLVRKVALRYVRQASRTCLTLDDLIGYGNEGLIKAIEKFDPKMGVSLSTYATEWIRQSITRHIADDGSMIRLPVHLVEKINKMTRLEQSQLKDLGKINVDEICAALEIDLDKYHDYQRLIYQFRSAASLNKLIEADGEGGTELGDFIVTDFSGGLAPAIDPETEALNESARQSIHGLLTAYLTPRQAQVIDMRFGFEDDQTHTLEEVGQQMGVTRERIRQIESKALRRLKRKMDRDGKEDYTIE
ncbi:sigma-70 family RNA polymerase sigma factor [Lacticaseibacillus kribbianus]|uniref:sigma-70 family RNA polymerase sigma factor n=1 Tax=Lacticaseibacillus kribbianus TaxID=2926292 RepID=UPI001CD8106F|nr:sigma-70 family RNA polymerase sigma factor [Lacticaseibacillus kribbianus]